MINTVVLAGYVATEPKSSETASGDLRCSFRLAVGNGKRGEDGREKADFFTVVCWRNTAKSCMNYLRKGRAAAAIGRLTTYAYTAQDGANRTEYQIEAATVRFLPSGQRAPEPTDAPDDWTEVSDDDMPF